MDAGRSKVTEARSHGDRRREGRGASCCCYAHHVRRTIVEFGNDAEHWNRVHQNEEAIQVPLDFEFDVMRWWRLMP
jgi:hypothetical protein